jgi:lysophospholipase L1-like esterase
MTDFPYLARYKEENHLLMQNGIPANRMVFLGDSITEFWSFEYPEFFEHSNYINRGIRGQTTPQLLGRFEQDVLQLKPESVHLLAGTNDIAGNTGLMTLEMTQQNILQMAKQATHAGIQVLIGSILPACHYSWSPKIKPSELIRELNHWVLATALQNNWKYIDYYSAMVDELGCMNPLYSEDGVHPNRNGYQCMVDIFNLATRQFEA